MIYLASDHRGFAVKEKLKQWLTEWKREFTDCGPAAFAEDDDYPDYVAIAAQKVAENPTGNFGIVLGASGQGEAMVANRRHGVRAAVYYGGSEEVIILVRLHNGANILSLGVAPGYTVGEARPLSEDVIRRAVELFLNTPFSNEERHVRRINKFD